MWEICENCKTFYCYTPLFRSWLRLFNKFRRNECKVSKEWLIWKTKWIGNDYHIKQKKWPGAGIYYCNNQGFLNFLKWAKKQDYQNKYLTRINDKLCYSPKNCKWVDRAELSRKPRKKNQMNRL